MKQITKTPDITEALQASVGPDVNVDNLAVYEAIAFNNRPVRKNHPLFKGAIADRSLLLEMAAALSIESRPLQVQHSDESLPSGRAFHGKVIDNGSESELRVLFFVDKNEVPLMAKIDSGTVDQVSVSILPKKMLNSVSGFDYLGDKATADNIWTGTDDKGNTIGKNGVYAKMVGLDKWFELSLVGMGGAENARIVSNRESYFGSSYQKLAASGVDPNYFLLEASTENNLMDPKEFIEKISTLSAANATFTADIATLTASNTALKAQVVDLEAKVAAAATPDAALTTAQADLAARTTEVADLTAANATAIAALQSVAKSILTASGKMDAQVPATIAELDALIKESSATLAAALANGGKSKDAIDDIDKDAAPLNLSAFRRPGRNR